MKTRSERWTNASALRLAEGADPVAAVTARARAVVLQALDAGWSGPPFDPAALAEHLRLALVARDDIPDARTVPVGKTLTIEFNPNRPAARQRYSIAHEIAHTLFPDCADHVRNRASYHNLSGDEWQLEALCNIAASEILMPAGSMPRLSTRQLTIERLMELRKRYEVSAEALLIRMTHVAQDRCAMFCASRAVEGAHSGRYRLDYVIGSQGWHVPIPRGSTIPEETCVAQCVAIGHTAAATEVWVTDHSVHIEAVAIPPYPGSIHPRVVGLLTAGDAHADEDGCLQYVRGDATAPRGRGVRLLAHIVNDATSSWGGGGFAQAVRKRLPSVQEEFQRWASARRDALVLGGVHFSVFDDGLMVASMIAQHGYGSSSRPRIRYGALASCLKLVATKASERGATVHIPRIGTGQAGGSWEIIEGMILQELCARDISVTVYDPPDRVIPQPNQPGLRFAPK